MRLSVVIAIVGCLLFAGSARARPANAITTRVNGVTTATWKHVNGDEMRHERGLTPRGEHFFRLTQTRGSSSISRTITRDANNNVRAKMMRFDLGPDGKIVSIKKLQTKVRGNVTEFFLSTKTHDVTQNGRTDRYEQTASNRGGMRIERVLVNGSQLLKSTGGAPLPPWDRVNTR
ncbi:MAG: hypothetical protein ABI321_08970 [Polyangia bacterium]